ISLSSSPLLSFTRRTGKYFLPYCTAQHAQLNMNIQPSGVGKTTYKMLGVQPTGVGWTAYGMYPFSAGEVTLEEHAKNYLQVHII
ncbi:MAG: hypothetical protein IJV22_05600, partial [Bacteroidales bacterium]|nr:hypothetical protein [Bacteroidales bacterium]